MADLERRVSSIEEHLAHIVATLDTLATNQNHLDEVLLTLTEAQIRNQEQFRETDTRFRETDTRIANLTSAIGQLIGEMRSKPN